MIRVTETLQCKRGVVIHVDGDLDREGLALLEGICHRHLKDKRQVFLELERLMEVCREGVDFLRQIQTKVVLIDPPSYIQLEEPACKAKERERIDPQ